MRESPTKRIEKDKWTAKTHSLLKQKVRQHIYPPKKKGKTNAAKS